MSTNLMVKSDIGIVPEYTDGYNDIVYVKKKFQN